MIREKVGVAPTKDKIRKTGPRWFSHVKRRSKNALVRRCVTISLSWYRRNGRRPKKSWNEVMRNDLKFIGLTEDMAEDRSL